MNDFHVVLDMVVGFTLIEAVVKPVAKKMTQVLLKRLDGRVGWIPDWLYDSEQ